MKENEITKKIESLLFYAGEPVEISELQEVLEVSNEEISTGLDELENSLSNRGIRLVRHTSGKSNTVMLATAPECSDTVEKMIRLERESTLGRASLETLSIVAYKGPVSKKEIEYIRGVNSDYALRALLLRGLVEKARSETDERVSMYTITSDTLLHLGITKISDLPEYDSVKKELEISEQAEEKINDEETEGNR
jgi:segregation and condensation protein B